MGCIEGKSNRLWDPVIDESLSLLECEPSVAKLAERESLAKLGANEKKQANAWSQTCWSVVDMEWTGRPAFDQRGHALPGAPGEDSRERGRRRPELGDAWPERAGRRRPEESVEGRRSDGRARRDESQGRGEHRRHGERLRGGREEIVCWQCNERGHRRSQCDRKVWCGACRSPEHTEQACGRSARERDGAYWRGSDHEDDGARRATDGDDFSF